LAVSYPVSRWERLTGSIYVGHRARGPGGNALDDVCRGGFDVDLAKGVGTRLVNREWPVVSAAVNLVLVLVFAHLVNQVSEGQIEGAVLVFTIGFGSVRVPGARQGQFNTIAPDEALARVVSTDGDLQVLRLGIELRNLGNLVVYVTPKTVGNFNVTSDDVQFHGDLLKVSVPPTDCGGFFRALVDMSTR
jgi:hypothetical protein